MATRIKTIPAKMKMQKVTELVVGILTASFIVLQIWNEGISDVLNALPIVLQ